MPRSSQKTPSGRAPVALRQDEYGRPTAYIEPLSPAHVSGLSLTLAALGEFGRNYLAVPFRGIAKKHRESVAKHGLGTTLTREAVIGATVAILGAGAIKGATAEPGSASLPHPVSNSKAKALNELAALKKTANAAAIRKFGINPEAFGFISSDNRPAALAVVQLDEMIRPGHHMHSVTFSTTTKSGRTVTYDITGASADALINTDTHKPNSSFLNENGFPASNGFVRGGRLVFKTDKNRIVSVDDTGATTVTPARGATLEA